MYVYTLMSELIKVFKISFENKNKIKIIQI